MIELPSLYEHQESHKDRARESLGRHRRVILCDPPGFGKTRLAKWILGSSLNREPGSNQSGRSLFAVQRRGLVDNAADSFSEAPGLPHGVIMADRDTSYGDRIQVASLDTLLSWFVENDDYQTDITFDLIVYDECHSHHSRLATFLKYHDEKRKQLGLHEAFLLGLSATPQAKGLADVYKEIITGPGTQWLIDNKYLAPFRYFRAKEGQLDKLVLRAGEFTAKSEAEAMASLQGEDLFEDWNRFAKGRPTVGFFRRRAYAHDAMARLAAKGLRVEYVDANTPDEDRRRIFRHLDRHHLDYLCNVQIVERGTNIPAVSCIQLCVAIGSKKRYRQMIGRGSRFDAEKYPDKIDTMILDHGGNIKRHGLFEDDPQWSLDVTTKEPGEVGARPTIECPKCQAIYRGGKCSHCGYEPSKSERKGQGLVFDGSELKEVTKSEPKETKVQSAEELMKDALFRAGRSGRTWRQCFGIFMRSSEAQGTNYRVPKTVAIAGRRYTMLRYDSDDKGRKVATLFPIVKGHHGGAYLVEEPPPVEAGF